MKHRTSRRSESGTITIMAVALLTTLMGMAALAVDLGFMYTRSRMLYAVADSAVAVGMKDLAAGKSNAQIGTDIADMAAKYTGYTISLTPTPTTTTVTVKVVATYPLFFGKMIGIPSKTMTVVTAATRPLPVPPILALGNTCGTGVTIFGQGVLQVDGDIQTNGSVTMSTGPTGPAVLGNVTGGAACGPVTLGPGATATGSVGTGGPFTDPFNPYTLTSAQCTRGSFTTAYFIQLSDWDLTKTPVKLNPGIYCSNAVLGVTSPGPGNGFDLTDVTLVSMGGLVTIQAGDASTMTPNPASPNGIIAYSTGDIAITGPASKAFDMGGSFYAPSGNVSINQYGPYTMGSIVAKTFTINDNNDWEIGVGASGGSNAWQMTQ
jgi:hypothetical protein